MSFYVYITYPNGLLRSMELESRDELQAPGVCSIISMPTWLELIATQGSDAAAKAALNSTDDVRDRDYQDRLPHEEGFGT
jgi:hypothetical protein